MKTLTSVLLIFTLLACSTGYKRQQYAKLKNSKDFENEFPIVWKAEIAALGEYKIQGKDAEKGLIVTDWIYSTSNDKYVEYQVNGFPRKHYLQTRYQFKIKTEKQLGGVRVTIDQEEEVEKINNDGTFKGWSSASEPDSLRANELLKNIETKILSLE